jgi:hypothetical protein
MPPGDLISFSLVVENHTVKPCPDPELNALEFRLGSRLDELSVPDHWDEELQVET